MSAGLAADETRQFVLATVEDVLDTRPEATEGILSVAAYVRDGIVDDARSDYRALGADGAAELARFARRRFDGANRLVVIHDGTAAASAVASDVPTAAIVFGTALGVGFSPHPADVSALAPLFRVTDAPDCDNWPR